MLPDLRFVIGAIFATAMLGIVAIGLFATVRMTRNAFYSLRTRARSGARFGFRFWD